MAIPLLLVVTVTLVDPAKLAAGPLAGAVKVTTAPLTGFPPPSMTVA